MLGRHSPNPDDAQVHRVGRQLALFTIVLMSLLLLLAGVTLYLRARDAMLSPLRQALVARARMARIDREHMSRPPGDTSRRHIPRLGADTSAGGANPLLDDVFVALANTHLHVVNHNGSPFGSRLPSVALAREVLAHHEGSFTFAVEGERHYLIYALPRRQGSRVTGVVETGILAEQYVEGLGALVQALIIVGVAGLIAAAVATALVVGRALRPIRSALRRQREFVADAAHELRTPLTIIRSTSEIALAEGDEEEQERAERILRQSTHLTHLVEDLSLLARADTGAVSLQQQAIELSDAVSDTVAGIAVLAEDRDVAIDLQLDKGISVRVDPIRLRQLLLILLDNALKFTPPGGTITVRVEHHRGHARLSVQDSGPGIAPGDLPHLFERFYRGDRARSSEGTGLGLAIGKWIVEAHGGRITADNAPRGGALFAATLPLAS